MIDLTEKTLTTERKYTGKIISVDLIGIELPEGRKTLSAWLCWTLQGHVE
ncbi:MAG: hypothetical protein IJG13_12840 [Kiritimatiellae bacterium]|nr:hypothetical protein [Kiritimatiellia bacterium]